MYDVEIKDADALQKLIGMMDGADVFSTPSEESLQEMTSLLLTSFENSYSNFQNLQKEIGWLMSDVDHEIRGHALDLIKSSESPEEYARSIIDAFASSHSLMHLKPALTELRQRHLDGIERAKEIEQQADAMSKSWFCDIVSMVELCHKATQLKPHQLLEITKTFELDSLKDLTPDNPPNPFNVLREVIQKHGDEGLNKLTDMLERINQQQTGRT